MTTETGPIARGRRCGIPAPIVGFIALVLPGAGHFATGYRGRGVAFFGVIAIMFAAGLSITEGYALSPKEHPLAFGAQVLAGVPAAVGLLLTGGGRTMDPGLLGRLPPPEVVSMFDLGLVFTMVAGLLNLLVVLDALDRASATQE